MILLIQEIKNFVLFVSFVVNLLSRILSQSRTHRVPLATGAIPKKVRNAYPTALEHFFVS
jgi:hypothetical protein